MTLPYRYAASARRAATGLAVLGVWIALALAFVFLDAAWWIIAFFAAFTLPAVSDLVVRPEASFTLSAQHIRWQTPRAEADIALAEVDHVRLDTRLDLSVRLSVVLRSGRRLRVPVPATPPVAALIAAAEAAGLRVERHHFSLIG